ncbi:hypothetical protein FJ987_25800 [Mesorhizobium sp. CU2]|uniref:hypothetical protein n=1 Tax=unclassified Mesorhizobium TaxID=325217 RepID=UPI001129D4EC|nr:MULTISPECIES: hypothetical protein [unclassified Mesorhizobium]TPN81049.1 hypothetical protein FJ988_19315 [Mesorhizobium sp. CU3]TPO05733.1 hypothetical protein FJ987_25800 [Mesorhizobium sp. CU2]
MAAKTRPLIALTCLALSACGTRVPEIQENAFASEHARTDFVNAIARNVRCEIQDAVVHLYAENQKIDPLNRNLGWFDSWAAQLSLTLTTEEKSSVNPVVNLLPPSPTTRVFNVNLGGTLSADATRIDKIGSFFTVAELKSLQACDPSERNTGPFILQGDLKLYEWLQATMISIGNRDTPAPANPSGPNKSNVISHQVKFEIVSTGNVTPGWKFVRATVNPSGNFLSATRDRIQDLTITFGPPDPNWSLVVIDPITKKPKINPATGKPLMRPTALAPAAASAAFAADVGTTVSANLANANAQ